MNDRSDRLAIEGNSIRIDNMYFKIDNIQFVNVVKQDRSWWYKGAVITLPLCIIIALACIGFAPGISAFYGLSALGIIIYFVKSKAKYALLFGLQLGSQKVLISTDKQGLERLKADIQAAISEYKTNAQKDS